MNDFLHNYALNSLIALVILWAGGVIVDDIYRVYYTYTSLDHFFESKSLAALDICAGDEHQSIISERYVYGTKVGYPADVTKELNRLEPQGLVKVYEERTSPFVEVAVQPTQRVQDIPSDLAPGQYQWILYVTLDINGVKRHVIPPLESNVFSILDCQQ